MNPVINLPLSKSIALRVLTMNAVSSACGRGSARIPRLPDAEDVAAMTSALESQATDIYIGEGGAPIRFYTALAASTPGKEVYLRGSERLMERPISLLVEALRSRGADIEYIERDGHAPLHICGCRLRGGEVSIDAGVSSQFLSALMMVSPLWETGLRLRLTGDRRVSQSYLSMTESVMRQYGIECRHEGNLIIPEHTAPTPPSDIYIEADWSAASYFYELAALCPGHDVEIASLTPAWESLQGDAACARIFKTLGVETIYNEDGGATLRCDAAVRDMMVSMLGRNQLLTLNLNSTPDLTPAVCVGFALAGMRFRLTGIEHLRHKESDRISALIGELRKLGYVLESDGTDLRWEGERCEAEHAPVIATYNDHRMAMAFAPARILYPGLTIEHPEVVGKSFPGYFAELNKLREIWEER